MKGAELGSDLTFIGELDSLGSFEPAAVRAEGADAWL